MVCEHLRPLEEVLLQAGIEETFRGKAWSENSREWVYFNCVLPLEDLQQHLSFPDCVQVHSHNGTHSGSESGFVCSIHDDGIMGIHPSAMKGAPVFSI